jgi:hypothetical protein
MYHVITTPHLNEMRDLNDLADRVTKHSVKLEELQTDSGFTKRLDTYIFNQAESTYRGLTELITNGIDASERLIGRFGVGFLQSLAFLKDPDDVLTVHSWKNGVEAVCIRFRKGIEGFEVSFLPSKENVHQPESLGTLITLTKSKPDPHFAQEIELYTRNLVSGCNLARILINSSLCNDVSGYELIGNPVIAQVTPDVEVAITANGFTVQDYGRGMDITDIRTKLLVPKFNEVTEAHNEFDPARTSMLVPQSTGKEPTRDQGCEVRIQVSGILVERLQVPGFNLPPSCMIELPPGTWLPESRNQVQLNHQVSQALLHLAQIVCDEITEPERVFKCLNAIAGTISELERRPGQSTECSSKLRNLACGYLAKHNKTALPNSTDFDYLDLSTQKQEVFLHPSLVRLDPSKLGYLAPPNFRSATHRLVVADFKPDARGNFLIHGDTVIFDRNLYERFRNEPGILNEILNPYIGYGPREVSKGYFTFVGDKPSGNEIVIQDSLDLSALPKQMANQVRRILKLRNDAAFTPDPRHYTEYGARLRHQWSQTVLGATTVIDQHTIDRLANAAKTISPTIQLLASLFRTQTKGLREPYQRYNLAKVTAEDGQEVYDNGGIDLRLVGIPLDRYTERDGFLEISSGIPDGTADSNQFKFNGFKDLAIEKGFFLEHGVIVSPLSSRFSWESMSDLNAAPPPSMFRSDNSSHRNELPKDFGPIYRDNLSWEKEHSAVGVKKGNSRILLEHPLFENARQICFCDSTRGPLIFVRGNSVTDDTTSDYINALLLKDGSFHEVGLNSVDPYAGNLMQDLISRVQGDARLDLYYYREQKTGLTVMLKFSGETFIELYRTAALHPRLVTETINNESFLLDQDSKRIFQIVGDSLVPIELFLDKLDGTVDLLQIGGLAVIRNTSSTKHRYLFFDGTSMLDLGDLLDIPPDGRSTRGLRPEKYGLFVTPRPEIFEMGLRENTFSEGKGHAFDEDKIATLTDAMNEHMDLLGSSLKARQKLFTNLWLLEDSSSQQLTQLFPWLIFLEPEALHKIPEDVRLKITPLANENPKLFAQYCSFFAEAFSRLGGGQTFTDVCERWYQLSSSQPAIADKLLLLLGQQYGSADKPLQGWSYFWRQRAHEAPPELRPYLEYLFGEFRFAMRDLPPEERALQVTPSQADPRPLASLVYSAQRMGKLGEITSLDHLGGVPETKDAAASLEIVARELCKTANSQDRSSLMWVRELVQNSRDALREEQGESSASEDTIEIESFYRDGFFGTTVRDPVGMSLHNLVYNLLVPDNSSKSSSLNLSGFFGHGFYTAFLGASQVEITTSLGDGTAYEMLISCEHDESGRLKNLHLDSFCQVASDFKGTDITRLEKCDRVTASFKHALVSDAAYRYLSTINTHECTITLNDQLVNQPFKKLGDVTGSIGTISLATLHDGFSRITSDGLYLTHMSDDKFGKLIPEILRPTLDRVGCVLDLPRALRPTRTRNALSGEEHFLDELQSMIGISSLVASVKLFMEEDFDIPGIPRDYLYQRALSTVSDPIILHDAEIINRYLVRPLDNQNLLADLNLENYVATDAGRKLAQLLTLVRVPMEYEGRTISLSLEELRAEIGKAAAVRAKQEPPPHSSDAVLGEEDTPKNFDAGRLGLGVNFRRQVDEAAAITSYQSAHVPSPSIVFPSEIQSNPTAPPVKGIDSSERNLLALVQHLVSVIDPTVKVCYRRDPHYSALFDYKERAVTVNLALAKETLLEPLRAITEGRATRTVRDQFVGALFDNVTHEMTHSLENYDDWTHQNETRFPESFRVRLERLRRHILQSRIDSDFFTQKLGSCIAFGDTPPRL